eukprot:TRINITY_DN67436_c0_g1_i1.p1 TRINITY_DN67436_c0_g1~~TRINITY_DN67436_c0_g1_i1.p1  ORF type:complete len:531 (+),score=55.68 TRINITY_DN67436_c0_g1_i1:82-1674(+)
MAYQIAFCPWLHPGGRKDVTLVEWCCQGLTVIAELVFSYIVVGTSVVLFWRGGWGILDHYLFTPSPDSTPEFRNAIICLIVGFGVLAVSACLTDALAATRQSTQRPVARALYLLGDRVWTLVLAWASVAAWRGSWYLWDTYVFPDRPVAQAATAHGCGLVICFGLWSMRSLPAPPAAVFTDGEANAFSVGRWPLVSRLWWSVAAPALAARLPTEPSMDSGAFVTTGTEAANGDRAAAYAVGTRDRDMPPLHLIAAGPALTLDSQLPANPPSRPASVEPSGRRPSATFSPGIDVASGAPWSAPSPASAPGFNRRVRWANAAFAAAVDTSGVEMEGRPAPADTAPAPDGGADAAGEDGLGADDGLGWCGPTSAGVAPSSEVHGETAMPHTAPSAAEGPSQTADIPMSAHVSDPAATPATTTARRACGKTLGLHLSTEALGVSLPSTPAVVRAANAKWSESREHTAVPPGHPLGNLLEESAPTGSTARTQPPSTAAEMESEAPLPEGIVAEDAIAAAPRILAPRVTRTATRSQ